MAPLKTLVFGATGAQGGSVCKYLLEEPDKFKVYGLTRHTDSAHAKKLASQGVTVLQGDLDDPKSYEDALKQVDAVFLNTNWWQWYRPDGKGGDNADECTKRETTQAIAVADAMKRLGGKHLVYSTLGHFEINGQKVAHSESKVIIEGHIKKIGLPTAYVSCVYYMSNVLGYPTKDNADGSITIECPIPDSAEIPQVPIEQLGLWVRAALSNWDKYNGQTIPCVTDKLSVARITEVLSEVTGKKFVPMHVTREWFESKEAADPNPEMHLNSYVFVDDLVKADIPDSRAIAPQAWDFKGWCLNAGGVEKKWGLKK